MKKTFLSFLLSIITLVSFSQQSDYVKERIRLGLPINNKASEEAEKEWAAKYAYKLSVGHSKLSASPDGMKGFTTKDSDIRIVGLLYRGEKILYKEIIVETKRDSVVVDTQVMNGHGISAKWRDIYIKLSDLVFSEHYTVNIYSSPEKVFIVSKEFYIRKEK